MKPTPVENPLALIELLAKQLADERAIVAERVQTLHDELEAAKRRKIPGIKTAVAEAVRLEARLIEEIKARRAHFDDPRTIVVSGLKVGLAKGRGKIEFADEATVIAKIEKIYTADEAALLVKTEKSVRKKALNALAVEDLRKIGCTVVAAGDHPYIAPVDDEVDKLVNRLLKAASEEEGA